MRRSPTGDANARQQLEQLGLPVAVDAGDAENLAATDRQADVGERVQAAPVGDTDVGQLEPRRGIARRLRAFFAGVVERADHQPGQLRFAHLMALRARDDTAGAHHEDTIGDRHHLAELVGDEQDRGAGVAQALEHGEELLDLARREHGGGLVENQDAGLAGQRFDDLDALAHADRQRADRRVEITQVEAYLLRQALRPGGHFGVLPQPSASAAHAEGEILANRERIDQGELLMHHADPARRASSALAKRTGWPSSCSIPVSGATRP